MLRVWDCSVLLGMSIVLSASLPGQAQIVVVPADHASTEASGVALWIASVDVRQQLLLGRSHLATVAGSDLAVLSLRHEGDLSTRAGRLWVEMTLSNTAVAPARASADFAKNRGTSPRSVFAGWVDFPTAGAVQTGPAPWQDPHMVSIRLQNPFRYDGTTLCIETVTRTRDPQNNPSPALPSWAVDALTLAAPGSVRQYGSSCVPAFAPMAAGAGERSLTLGGEAFFYLLGRNNQLPVMLVLGVTPVDVDLASSGAPGCSLYVADWFLVAQGTVTPRRGSFGLAPATLPLPINPLLSALSIYSQWIAVTPSANQLGLTTSNGVECRLGSPRDASHAWIESENPDSAVGVVGFDRVPVLRLEFSKP